MISWRRGYPEANLRHRNWEGSFRVQFFWCHLLIWVELRRVVSLAMKNGSFTGVSVAKNKNRNGCTAVIFRKILGNFKFDLQGKDCTLDMKIFDKGEFSFKFETETSLRTMFKFVLKCFPWICSAPIKKYFTSKNIRLRKICLNFANFVGNLPKTKDITFTGIDVTPFLFKDKQTFFKRKWVIEMSWF